MIGGGGHASVLIDICNQQNREVIAIFSPDDIDTRKIFNGIQHFKNDEDILHFSAEEIELINGIGSVKDVNLRKNIADKFMQLGYQFATVVANSAIVSEEVSFERGVQILPGAIINSGVSIGQHAIINSGALIEHDCVIDEFVHVCPRAVICGHVKIENCCIIGPSSVIGIGLKIGENSAVGAGASVVRSIDKSKKVLPVKTIINSR